MTPIRRRSERGAGIPLASHRPGPAPGSSLTHPHPHPSDLYPPTARTRTAHAQHPHPHNSHLLHRTRHAPAPVHAPVRTRTTPQSHAPHSAAAAHSPPWTSRHPRNATLVP